MGTAKEILGDQEQKWLSMAPKVSKQFLLTRPTIPSSYHTIQRLNISDHEKQQLFKANVAQSEKRHRCQTGEHVGNKLVRSTTGISVNRTKHEKKGTQNRKCIVIRNLQSSIKTFKYHAFENKEHWLHRGNQG